MKFYDLLEEYAMRSAWPGLFGYLDFVWPPAPKGIIYKFSAQERNQLEHFQELHTDEYQEQQRAKHDAELPSVVADTRQLGSRTWALVQQLHTQLVSQEHTAAKEIKDIEPPLPAPAQIDSQATTPLPRASVRDPLMKAMSKPSMFACEHLHMKLSLSWAAREYPIAERDPLTLKISECREIVSRMYRQEPTIYKLCNGQQVAIQFFKYTGPNLSLEMACFKAESEAPSVNPLKCYNYDGKVLYVNHFNFYCSE